MFQLKKTKICIECCSLPYKAIWKMIISHMTFIGYRTGCPTYLSRNCNIGKYKCKFSKDPPNKVEIEKDGTRTELAFNKETVPY